MAQNSPPLEVLKLLATARSAWRSPDAGGAIVAGGRNAPAVGKKRHAQDHAGVAFVLMQPSAETDTHTTTLVCAVMRISG